jgi:hypothetical protein
MAGPDIHSDEFRNAMYNFFLSINGKVTNIDRVIVPIDGIPFKDLTPEKWAEICSGVDDLKDILEMTRDSLKTSGMVFDSPEALDLIKDMTDTRIQESKGEGHVG